MDVWTCGRGPSLAALVNAPAAGRHSSTPTACCSSRSRSAAGDIASGRSTSNRIRAIPLPFLFRRTGQAYCSRRGINELSKDDEGSGFRVQGSAGNRARPRPRPRPRNPSEPGRPVSRKPRPASLAVVDVDVDVDVLSTDPRTLNPEPRTLNPEPSNLLAPTAPPVSERRPACWGRRSLRCGGSGSPGAHPGGGRG